MIGVTIREHLRGQGDLHANTHLLGMAGFHRSGGEQILWGRVSPNL